MPPGADGRECLNFTSERTIEVKAKTTLYWTMTWLIAFETFVGGVMDLTHGRTGVVSGPFVTQVVSGLG
jgi:hypothetical protein